MYEDWIYRVVSVPIYQCREHGIHNYMITHEYHMSCGICGQQMRKLT